MADWCATTGRGQGVSTRSHVSHSNVWQCRDAFRPIAETKCTATQIVFYFESLQMFWRFVTERVTGQLMNAHAGFALKTIAMDEKKITR